MNNDNDPENYHYDCRHSWLPKIRWRKIAGGDPVSDDEQRDADAEYEKWWLKLSKDKPQLTIRQLMELLAATLHERAMATFDVEGLMEGTQSATPEGDGIEFVGGGPWDGCRRAPACVGMVHDVIKTPPLLNVQAMHGGEGAAVVPMNVHRYLRARRKDGRYVMEYVGIAKR